MIRAVGRSSPWCLIILGQASNNDDANPVVHISSTRRGRDTKVVETTILKLMDDQPTLPSSTEDDVLNASVALPLLAPSRDHFVH
jgi:hypothetical protein